MSELEPIFSFGNQKTISATTHSNFKISPYYHIEIQTYIYLKTWWHTHTQWWHIACHTKKMSQ